MPTFEPRELPNLSAGEVILAFHGPFLLISRSQGVDVLVPKIDKHEFVWGTDPFLVREDPHTPASIVMPEKVRYRVKIPADPQRKIRLEGLQAGPNRPRFDPKRSLCLPPIAPPSQPSADLLAHFHLPWPDEVITTRERVLEVNEKYVLSAGGVKLTKKRSGRRECSSLIHILKYRGTGPAGKSVLVHFHNEFADRATALATNAANPNHDIEAFKKCLPGLEIQATMPPTIRQNPTPPDSFMPDLSRAHWRSLYETVLAGAENINCDGATGNC